MPHFQPVSFSNIGISTESTAPGVVVELQTKMCPFFPAARTALATGCIAFNKYSVAKLPSGRLGDGGIKNDASVATVSDGSSVARRRSRPSFIVSASSGSSTGGRPAFTLRIFSGSISTPTTEKPRAAKVAAMHAPSLPKPQTETDLIDFMHSRADNRVPEPQ